MTVREWFRGMRTIEVAIDVDYLLSQPRGPSYRWNALRLLLVFDRSAYEREEALHALIREDMERATREVLYRDLVR